MFPPLEPLLIDGQLYLSDDTGRGYWVWAMRPDSEAYFVTSDRCSCPSRELVCKHRRALFPRLIPTRPLERGER